MWKALRADPSRGDLGVSVRADIAGRGCAPGILCGARTMIKTTIDDIAAELGLSKSTVSRAISGKGRISEAKDSGFST